MTWTSPRLWKPRQVPTAADLNLYVRDNLAEMTTDNAWTAPTLLTGWVNYDASHEQAGYRRQGGMLMFRGLIRSGTATPLTPLFTLPVGLRPTKVIGIATIASGPFTWGRLTVETNGNVVYAIGSVNGWLVLRGGFPVAGS
jgi:hypothetical protein